MSYLASNLAKYLEIQSTLNNATLREKSVVGVDNGQAHQLSMNLARREGGFIRHQSALVQLIDMYQWAGNRETAELIECYPNMELDNDQRANARIEVVDVIHFDLSLLILTGATPEEIDAAFSALKTEASEAGSLYDLLDARANFDNLQLRKWWSSNVVQISEIRTLAITQFVALLRFATQSATNRLFESFDDLWQTYEKKVEVNYNRLKQNYDHVKNAEMGNASIK